MKNSALLCRLSLRLVVVVVVSLPFLFQLIPAPSSTTCVHSGVYGDGRGSKWPQSCGQRTSATVLGLNDRGRMRFERVEAHHHHHQPASPTGTSNAAIRLKRFLVSLGIVARRRPCSITTSVAWLDPSRT